MFGTPVTFNGRTYQGIRLRVLKKPDVPVAMPASAATMPIQQLSKQPTTEAMGPAPLADDEIPF